MAERVPPLSDDEARDLARRIVQHEVFVAQDAYELECFSILHFLPSIPENAALVWEAWSEVGPLAVNGQPRFLSCHFVAQESVEALNTHLTQMAEALGLNVVGPSD